MEFWIFMVIMDLLLPFMMIGFGKYFMKKAPKEINSVFGYRTSMSMKNKDTWEFAHKYCGKVWYVCGMVINHIAIEQKSFALTGVGYIGQLMRRNVQPLCQNTSVIACSSCPWSRPTA